MRILLIILSVLACLVSFSQSNIFISEYVEGTGNSKAIEIYNPTALPVDLSNYQAKRYQNGSTAPASGGTTTLVGILQPYSTFVLVNGQTANGPMLPCDPALQAFADQLDHEYPAPMYFNGNDALTIEHVNGTIIDIFGKVGQDPQAGWCDDSTLNYAAGIYDSLSWTSNHTLIRKPNVSHGVYNNPGSVGAPQYFNVSLEWDSLPVATYSHLGWHIYNGAPFIADFICDTTQALIGDTIHFFDSSVGSPTSWQWDFGDGATSVDQNPIHVYLAAGLYSVTLITTNPFSSDTAIYQNFIDIIYYSDTQNISLPQGWSLFSSYVNPFQASFDSLCSSIVSEVIIAKDGSGHVYWPMWNLNAIGEILIGDAYQINMDTAQTMIVVGLAVIPENTPISVDQGWSFLGYLRQSPASIEIMLSPIVSEIKIAKNGDGQVYWPQFNLNLIGAMIPGKGYQIKMLTSQVLTYPSN